MPDASKLNFLTTSNLDKVPYSDVLEHTAPAAPDLGGGFFGPVEEERVIPNPYGKKCLITGSFTINGTDYYPIRLVTYNASSSYGNPAGVCIAVDDANITFWFTHYIGSITTFRVRWILDTIT